MSDKSLMQAVQSQLSGNLHKARRGGCQPLINHYSAVYTGFKKLVNGDGVTDETWEAAAFLHDAVEDGIIKMNDSRMSEKLREYLTILTPMPKETPEAHFERQLASKYPQVAAILYANCIHNSCFSEIEKMYMEDVELDSWTIARPRYFQRAGRALTRYAELQYSVVTLEETV